jgi:hypothetical protein
MSAYQSEKSEMSSAVEASVLVRRAAEPREVGDSVKAAISRSSKRLGFSFSRTKDIWYRHARRIHADEMDILREHVARAEAQLAVTNLLALRNRLAATGQDVHRTTIARLDDALRAMGAEVGAVAVREE